MINRGGVTEGGGGAFAAPCLALQAETVGVKTQLLEERNVPMVLEHLYRT